MNQPVPFHRIDKRLFSLKVPNTEEFWQSGIGVSDLCDRITSALCDAASASVKKSAKRGSTKVTKTSEDRWQKILSYDDPKVLQNAINWRARLIRLVTLQKRHLIKNFVNIMNHC